MYLANHNFTDKHIHNPTCVYTFILSVLSRSYVAKLLFTFRVINLCVLCWAPRAFVEAQIHTEQSRRLSRLSDFHETLVLAYRGVFDEQHILYKFRVSRDYMGILFICRLCTYIRVLSLSHTHTRVAFHVQHVNVCFGINVFLSAESRMCAILCSHV